MKNSFKFLTVAAFASVALIGCSSSSDDGNKPSGGNDDGDKTLAPIARQLDVATGSELLVAKVTNKGTETIAGTCGTNNLKVEGDLIGIETSKVTGNNIACKVTFTGKGTLDFTFKKEFKNNSVKTYAANGTNDAADTSKELDKVDFAKADTNKKLFAHLYTTDSYKADFTKKAAGGKASSGKIFVDLSGTKKGAINNELCGDAANNGECEYTITAPGTRAEKQNDTIQYSSATGTTDYNTLPVTYAANPDAQPTLTITPVSVKSKIGTSKAAVFTLTSAASGGLDITTIKPAEDLEFNCSVKPSDVVRASGGTPEVVTALINIDTETYSGTIGVDSEKLKLVGAVNCAITSPSRKFQVAGGEISFTAEANLSDGTGIEFSDVTSAAKEFDGVLEVKKEPASTKVKLQAPAGKLKVYAYTAAPQEPAVLETTPASKLVVFTPTEENYALPTFTHIKIAGNEAGNVHYNVDASSDSPANTKAGETAFAKSEADTKFIFLQAASYIADDSLTLQVLKASGGDVVGSKKLTIKDKPRVTAAKVKDAASTSTISVYEVTIHPNGNEIASTAKLACYAANEGGNAITNAACNNVVLGTIQNNKALVALETPGNQVPFIGLVAQDGTELGADRAETDFNAKSASTDDSKEYTITKLTGDNALVEDKGAITVQVNQAAQFKVDISELYNYTIAQGAIKKSENVNATTIAGLVKSSVETLTIESTDCGSAMIKDNGQSFTGGTSDKKSCTYTITSKNQSEDTGKTFTIATDKNGATGAGEISNNTVTVTSKTAPSASGNVVQY